MANTSLVYQDKKKTRAPSLKAEAGIAMLDLAAEKNGMVQWFHVENVGKT